jgi:hypothetical protein
MPIVLTYGHLDELLEGPPRGPTIGWHKHQWSARNTCAYLIRDARRRGRSVGVIEPGRSWMLHGERTICVELDPDPGLLAHHEARLAEYHRFCADSEELEAAGFVWGAVDPGWPQTWDLQVDTGPAAWYLVERDSQGAFTLWHTHRKRSTEGGAERLGQWSTVAQLLAYLDTHRGQS